MPAHKLRSLCATCLLTLSCCGDPSTHTALSSAKPKGPELSPGPSAREPPAEHDHSKHALPAAAALATDSVYHSSIALTDQDGQALALDSLRGSVVLATMFYASCTSVCPMLIAQLDRIVSGLPSDARAQTHVLLVSLDPQRDSAENLKRLAQRHHLTDPHWHFARTESDGVRELAALLGIRYRRLPDNEISHAQVIALLDREGVIIERMEDAAGNPAQLLAAATQAARTATPHAHR